jgi:hypothetical protein
VLVAAPPNWVKMLIFFSLVIDILISFRANGIASFKFFMAAKVGEFSKCRTF